MDASTSRHSHLHQDQQQFDNSLLYDNRSATPIATATAFPTMTYHSHPGCVLCSIVSSTSSITHNSNLSANDGIIGSGSSLSRPTTPSPQPSPTTASSFLPHPSPSPSPYPYPFSSSNVSQPYNTGANLNSGVIANIDGREVIHQDGEITIYRAIGKERLCNDGKHLIIIINRHIETVYDFGPADVPLLSHLIEITHRLLLSSTTSESADSHITITPSEAERGKGKAKEGTRIQTDDFRVGFVGSVTRDPQSPHAHLHAHAMIGPIDRSLPGATFWRRNVVFGSMNWWAVDDLVAEIRESTSNNRIKSGYQDRSRAPINRVPDAGSVEGLPNALDPKEYKDSSPPPSATIAKGKGKGKANEDGNDASTSAKGPMVSVSLSPPRATSKITHSTSDQGQVSRQNSDGPSGSGSGSSGDTEEYVAVELDDTQS